MNKMLKFGTACVALAIAGSVFADDDADEAEIRAQNGGAVGYTAVAVSLASPVQLPWGLGRWDVFGLDLGLFYNDVVKMYGLDVALATTTRGDMIGLDASGVFNYATNNVYGVRATCGANICRETVYGLEIGGFGYQNSVYGIDVELLSCMQKNICGLDASLIANLTEEESWGCTVALGVNMAKVAYGAQIAGVFNEAEELHGMQFGLVNLARDCQWGFQVGLINIIMSNQLKVLPIVNGYF